MRRLMRNMVSYLVAITFLSSLASKGVAQDDSLNSNWQKRWQSIEQKGEDCENRFDNVEAKKYYQQGLEVAAKFGQDSNQRLESLAHISNICVLQNELSEAETYYLALISLVQEKKKRNTRLSHFGFNDGLMSAMDDLADSYFNCSINSKKLENMKHALRIRDLISGDAHPEMSKNLWALVLYYFNLQKYFDAEPYADRLVRIDEKRLRFNDPELGTKFKTLGTIKGNNRKFNEAESYLRQAVSTFNSAKRPLPLQVALVKTELALVLMKKNDLVNAEKAASESLSILESLFGKSSTETAGTRGMLASIQMKRKLWSKAEQNLLFSLNTLEIKFGVNHPVQVSTLKQLQECYLAMGNTRQAKAMGERAKTIEKLMSKVKTRN